MSNNPDTPLVANSWHEHQPSVHNVGRRRHARDLARRILTRNTYLFSLTVTRDALTGKIRLTADGPISYRTPAGIARKGGAFY